MVHNLVLIAILPSVPGDLGSRRRRVLGCAGGNRKGFAKREQGLRKRTGRPTGEIAFVH
jgi:hypothetical protein